MKKRILTVVLSIAAVVGIVMVLNANMLFPWQYQARRNRKAILEYVRNTYPKAIMIEEHYQTMKFNPTNKPHDVIWFELDGIKFYVAACDGIVGDNDDDYPEARVTAQFDKIIKDGFLKPKQITSAVPSYTFYDGYKKYPYTGELAVELNIFGEGVIPQKIEWLYDFYKYWKKEGTILREYRVYLILYATSSKRDSYILIENDSDFADENEFYSAFIKYPY